MHVSNHHAYSMSCADGISVNADHLPDCAHRVCKRSVSEKNI